MIEVRDLHFEYLEGVKALDGVSLRIEDRELVAIMGENGSGKTTLVKHFNGLLKPTKGTVTVDGIDTTKASVAELSRRVGIAFQNPDHQFFCETVEKEIEFALRNFGFSEKEIKERVDHALSFFRLSEYRNSSPFTLSGGEKKRLTLAIVTAWDPKVIILDEPTMGQDQQYKEKLRDLILKLSKSGKTIILVTQDVEFIAELNPRVILLSRGKVVADGSAKEVLTNYAYVKRASLILPQLTQLAIRLSDVGIPKDVMSVQEAEEHILRILRRG